MYRDVNNIILIIMGYGMTHELVLFKWVSAPMDNIIHTF